MLACYLDDSGTDEDNRLIACAGYVASIDQWLLFEQEVEPIFMDYKVPILHAMELEKTEGPFEGWKILKKQAFVAKVCSILSRHAIMGVSMSAVKPVYKKRSSEIARKKTVAPYTFCVNSILNWLLLDIRLGASVHKYGVSLIFEEGNRNNQEIVNHIDGMRPKYPDLDAAIRSIIFVPKTHSRAIQMADLLAYYSRRHSTQMEACRQSNEARKDLTEPSAMIKIITETLPHRGFVATDFDSPLGSRFLSGASDQPD